MARKSPESLRDDPFEFDTSTKDEMRDVKNVPLRDMGGHYVNPENIDDQSIVRSKSQKPETPEMPHGSHLVSKTETKKLQGVDFDSNNSQNDWLPEKLTSGSDLKIAQTGHNILKTPSATSRKPDHTAENIVYDLDQKFRFDKLNTFKAWLDRKYRHGETHHSKPTKNKGGETIRRPQKDIEAT